MAGRVSDGDGYKGSAETEDRHRAHTRKIPYSSLRRTDAGPRSPPSLHVAGNIVSTEPLNVSPSALITRDDNDSDHYTYGSEREAWQTCEAQREDIARRVSSLTLDEGEPHPLSNDPARKNKEMPMSYADVLKNPTITRPRQASDGVPFDANGQWPSLPRKTTREPNELQRQGLTPDTKTLAQSIQGVVGKAVDLIKAKQKVNIAIESSDAQGPRGQDTKNRPVAEDAILNEEDSPPPFTTNFRRIHLETPNVPLSSRYQKLNLESHDAVVQCATGGSSSSGPQKQSAQYSNDSRGGPRRGAGKGGKRIKEDGAGRDDNGDDGDGTDGNGNDPKRSKGDSPQSPGPPKWFACHFHKRDPQYFSTNRETRMRYKTCGAGKWTEISRLKQVAVSLDHSHLLIDLGSICIGHIPILLSAGISPVVEKELRKRPKSAKSDEEKWYAIWRVLFPDEVLPSSPYSDPHANYDSQETETFHEYLEHRMPDHFRTNFSAALDQMNFSEELKRRVTDIAVQKEMDSRKELWEFHEIGRTLYHHQASDSSEDHSVTESIPTATQPENLRFVQSSNALYQRPGFGNKATTGHSAVNNHEYQSPGSLDYQPPMTPTPATPKFDQHLEGPLTPTRQHSLSSKSHDSGIGSDLHSYTTGDTGYINPANLTPTPHMPHSRHRNEPSTMDANPLNGNLQASSYYPHPTASSSPWTSDSQFPDLELSDAIPQESLDLDALNSPRNIYY
ncbi:hypothetical protein EG329_000630 [Mollisiaceae sp. DMI_Dod_QoI]|nr:hypothetical protein EG329_000630 [Helotiales sp. DMI_Dod_QoI]